MKKKERGGTLEGQARKAVWFSQDESSRVKTAFRWTGDWVGR